MPPRSKRPLVPDPQTRPTISVPEAGELLGLKRSSSYEAAHRGDIPTIAVGRQMRVPTAKLLALLGLA